MKKIGFSLLLAAVVALPLASANHGLGGRIVGTTAGGELVEAKISYLTGNFNTQTWRFTWTVGDNAAFTCNGFGSIEIGFTSVNCATPFSTGATGDSHGYPFGSADVHQISFSVGGAAGSGQQIVCADSGPAGTACNTLFAAAP